MSAPRLLALHLKAVRQILRQSVDAEFAQGGLGEVLARIATHT
jgi:hypothetical protein